MVNEGTSTQGEKRSLERVLRKTFKKPLDSVAGLLDRAGVGPNTITLLGLGVTAVSAVLLGFGNILAGGLVLLIGAPLDAIDGSLARLKGKSTPFGAFLDSVTDRYGELLIFGGLLIHFLQTGDQTACLLVFISAAGSVLVSYVKARAESLGFDGKAGFFSRVVRMIVLIPCLIFNFPLVALWILAIFTNLTALHRFFHVYRQTT